MKESLYDRLKPENLEHLNRSSKRFPHIGAKIERVLREKEFVLELTIEDLDDMNGMVTDHQNTMTNLNIYNFFNKDA